MNFLTRYLPFVAAMALVVVASNILVQFPMQGQVGGLSLADLLTWGAFTYPFSFLVTDLANRRYGPAVARKVVFVGFMTAVTCSILVPPFLFRHGLIEFETAADRLVRIAAASGAAFSAAFAFAGPNDSFALEAAPLMGMLPVETMRWVSWALGDLSVKLIIAVVALIPYRLLAARWSQPAVAVGA
ncbi:MAG: VUT family protein [Mesorhizobium sp.]|uniref:queuosine precursor transporter n=1 Tax=Mesorhizobium sp. TaxID=1871066 RepID=UPI000FE7E4BE|nr:queuosine precursor transporter [Mesorhizobium sp.]RWC16539.1 MAG: VUT family protein [Mesorhizobium sp.]